MKSTKIAALLLAGTLFVPAAAQAHISLHPNTIPAGAFATLDVRVPGEQEGAYVKKVDVLFPQGFTGVDYENVPGWSTKVIETKLATPIVEDGETIDTEVSQIVWTWTGPLGKVDNGQVVHWISPSLTAEHPSPRINVTAKGGVIQDVAGDEAGPQAGQTGTSSSTAAPTPSATTSSKGASKGLGIAALILGALGLIAGLAALAASRRESAV
jgi:uncharacterized protein YcnI